MTFPKNFFWGAATASHQIEGGTTNDWSEWEKQNAQRLAVDIPKFFEKRSPVWEQVKAEATNPANYVSGVAAIRIMRGGFVIINRALFKIRNNHGVCYSRIPASERF